MPRPQQRQHRTARRHRRHDAIGATPHATLHESAGPRVVSTVRHRCISIGGAAAAVLFRALSLAIRFLLLSLLRLLLRRVHRFRFPMLAIADSVPTIRALV